MTVQNFLLPTVRIGVVGSVPVGGDIFSIHIYKWQHVILLYICMIEYK
jgi:hypothetical protein